MKHVEAHVQIIPLTFRNRHIVCASPRCGDGEPRQAKWTFPQTAHLLTGAFAACDRHVADVAHIVWDYHVDHSMPPENVLDLLTRKLEG